MCFQERERERERADRQKECETENRGASCGKGERKMCGQEFLKWELVLHEPVGRHIYMLISAEDQMAAGDVARVSSARNNNIESSSWEDKKEKKTHLDFYY